MFIFGSSTLYFYSIWYRHSVSGRAVHGRSQRVTIPDAVKIQCWPPEEEHSISRNISRYLMWYIYYSIKELCIKLVIKTRLYHDARSEKHEIRLSLGSVSTESAARYESKGTSEQQPYIFMGTKTEHVSSQRQTQWKSIWETVIH
jgi:hypothetical protein